MSLRDHVLSRLPASQSARIVLHFHPNWFWFKSMTVAQALHEDGAYRNQF